MGHGRGGQFAQRNSRGSQGDQSKLGGVVSAICGNDSASKLSQAQQSQTPSRHHDPAGVFLIKHISMHQTANDNIVLPAVAAKAEQIRHLRGIV